ncbi:MAG: hypothetical protein ACKVT0_05615 [Planctomycetaceae bacterium]
MGLPTGCKALSVKDHRFYSGLFSGKSDFKLAEKYRERYQETREPDAICWLLAHEIHSGMSLDDVNRTLGENGVREENSSWLTTNGGNYRTDDDVYRWGPDSEGGTIYLVFRENHLVNFDPHEFEDRLKEKTYKFAE